MGTWSVNGGSVTSNETCGDMEREGRGEGCGSERDRWGPRTVSTHNTHGQHGSADVLTFGFSCSFHDWNTRNVCEELACKSEATETCADTNRVNLRQFLYWGKHVLKDSNLASLLLFSGWKEMRWDGERNWSTTASQNRLTLLVVELAYVRSSNRAQGLSTPAAHTTGRLTSHPLKWAWGAWSCRSHHEYTPYAAW